MRRHDQRDEARRPRAHARSMKHSGGIGAPPGTTMSPCWEPADEAGPEFDPDPVEKARPGAEPFEETPQMTCARASLQMRIF